MRGWSCCALVCALACGGDDASDAGVDAGEDAAITEDAAVDAAPADGGAPEPPEVFAGVEERGRIAIGGLGAPAYVLYDEVGVPHVFAEDREDLARVSGFVVARDRFFEMDMARRLSVGEIASLLGEAALEVDLESRSTGMRVVAERTLARFTEEQRAIFGAYAEGVNAYIEAVRTRRAVAPREYMIAGPIFGGAPADLMEDFGVEDVAAIAATVTYELGFETTDLGRQRGLEELPDRYAGEPLAVLRQAGLEDAFFRVTNSNGYASAAGWGVELVAPGPSRVTLDFLPSFGGGEGDALARMLPHAERIQRRLGRTHDEGFGSNAWAVGGELTVDGAAIVAGDGHLPGTVPTLFYRIGMDTALLGGGETHQVGMTFPGVPIMAIGTNGWVAWNQTQFFGDITDWYAEELLLDADGAPRATVYQDEERPLVVVEEEYVVADVPALESVGRTETLRRWETFDGRLVTSIEGRPVSADEPLGDGETRVNLMGDWVVPQDTDDDGIVRAISFDYTALDGPNFALTLEDWGHARTVEEMRTAATALVAYSQNVVAGDHEGSVAYLPYQVMPCRRHLRDGTVWAEGGHPGLVIDGTRFGGFALPLTNEGRVTESSEEPPDRCVVPLDSYPSAVNPTRGFVVTANNDPGTMTADNDLENDPHYVGGPWHEDFRAARIDAMIRAAAGAIDEDATAAMQADHRSPIGALLAPLLLEAIEAARDASEGTPESESEARMAALHEEHAEDFGDVETRIRAWGEAGYLAESGVETFYSSPSAEDRRHAIATTIFNAWLGPFDRRVLGDEGFPGGTFTPTGSGGKMRVLTRLVNGRGAEDPLALASFHPETRESAFFDVRGTPEIETSLEVALLALVDALAFLRSEPTEPGFGGFGSEDPDTWLWGLRHHTRFEALISDFLEGDEAFGFLADVFDISTRTLPLAEELAESDPRFGVLGFPRHGDNFCVDAANSGFGGERFTFGSVAVTRGVVALRGPEATTGRDILPGGQSGIPDTDHYADQTRLWLANEATPLLLQPEAIAAAATHRETFLP